jgi:hypothetical protein
MKEIAVENIKWQRRAKLEPGIAMLPLEDEEASRRGLPRFTMIQVPAKRPKDKLADYVIQFLENRYDYKVASFSIAEGQL